MVKLGIRLPEGRAKEPFPPTDVQVTSYHALRTDVLSGAHLRRVVQPQEGPVRISGASESEDGGTTSSAEAEPVQISGTLAAAIRAVEEASGASGARHRTDEPICPPLDLPGLRGLPAWPLLLSARGICHAP
jgi:hypothetical protein